MLRELFPEISLQAEDLLLLEGFQINYLPGRVAKKEFAALLRTYPVVHRFLVNKHPPIETFLSGLLEEHVPLQNTNQIEEYCQEALWEIADLIIYNKHPDLYDSKGRIRWDIEEITAVASLDTVHNSLENDLASDLSAAVTMAIVAIPDAIASALLVVFNPSTVSMP